MKKLAALLCLVSLPCFGAHTFVSPSGSDSNDCLSSGSPCLTIQRGVNQAGQMGTVYVAAGTYTAGANVEHNRTIHIEGAGGCANPEAVVINGPGTTVFTVQDHATLTMSGLRINALGGIIFASRQFAIGDYQCTHFGPANIHVSVNEMSKINCLSVKIYGNAIYHAAVNGMSSFSMSCTMYIDAPVTFTSMLWVGGRSYVLANPLTATGTFSGGAQYINDTSLIVSPASGWPGGNPGLNVCQNGCVIQ